MKPIIPDYDWVIFRVTLINMSTLKHIKGDNKYDYQEVLTIQVIEIPM